MALVFDCYLIVAILFSLSVALEASNICTSRDRYGVDVNNPGVSCADIYDNNPATRGKSGYYIVKTNDCQVHTAFCDMELECGGHKGGWMKVADHDISKGDDCPKGWSKTKANSIDVCRPPSDNVGCYSTLFSVHNISYNKICGKIEGYQKGATDGLRESSIDSTYVDGISITLGSPRKHVWTYAAGLSDDYKGNHADNCPCAKHGGRAAPVFVGNHYYCESGNTGPYEIPSYYTNDPLWDGNGCLAGNNCCANTDQPWFFRQMVVERQDDIEARMCADQGFKDEGAVVKQIQLYVQ